MTSADVRSKLVESLELDLVGPRPGLGDANEILPQSPSRWYLTGFLVPIDAASSQKVDEEATEELDSAESGGVDDDEPCLLCSKLRKIVFSVWVTLSEHKRVILHECRSQRLCRSLLLEQSDRQPHSHAQ